MKNFKDTATTILGIIFAICTALVTLSVSMPTIFPTWVNTACGVLIAISGALLGYLTGKNPDGSKKTPEQAEQINNMAKPMELAKPN